MGFKIQAALLCDDVRREDTGKNLLIGVYGGSVTLGIKPAVANVIFFLSGPCDGVQTSIEMRTRGYGIETRRTMVIPPGEPYMNMINQLSVGVIEPRDLEIDIRIDESDWVNVGQWGFLFGDDCVDAPPEQDQAVRGFVKASQKASPIGLTKEHHQLESSEDK